MWFQITHLPQKGTCFGKLTNITFAFLLIPTILQYFKQIFIQVANSGSNQAQVAHFSQDICSGKIDYYFCMPIVFYLTIIFLKKSQRKNHQTRLHNSGLNWAWSCPSKGNLLEKLTNITLVFYIPSRCVISKKFLSEQIVRLHIFAQISLCYKRKFSLKID